MPMPVSLTANAITAVGLHEWRRCRGSTRSSADADLHVHGAGLGELERVREQVLQDLAQTLRVGDDDVAGSSGAMSIE